MNRLKKILLPYLIVLFSLLFVISCGDTTEPSEEDTFAVLEVHGRSNCIFLPNTNAVPIASTLTPGNYTVNVTGDANYCISDPTASKFDYIFIQYTGETKLGHDIIPAGSSKQIYAQGNLLYVFVADWSATSDNGGKDSVQIGNNLLIVHGRDNCILLDNTNAAVIQSMPAGSYTLKTTGSAHYASDGTTFNKVFIRYTGATKDTEDALDMNSTKQINVRGGRFYAFFTDWGSTADNGGTVKITIYKD